MERARAAQARRLSPVGLGSRPGSLDRHGCPQWLKGMPMGLPVIESCTDCGACCRFVTSPPFRRVFDEAGEDAWERLRRERPDLVAEIVATTAARRAAGQPSYGSECLWYDAVGRVCRHYELRPQACRDFAVASTDCHDARRRAGVR